MTNDIYATVAKQLRLKRLQAGLTIEELAETAGISTSFLAYLETNKKKASLATIVKLAGALGIAVSELLDESAAFTVPDGNEKIFNRIVKLLCRQPPADTEIMLATLAALAKSLRRSR
ncbi:MAG: helix-turn-helix transcriptional regulator [Elusimicrobiaceae bacterium]|nr:helix-turn-helix transcriptional regulator [Elusimicrobiaceae bacterium]